MSDDVTSDRSPSTNSLNQDGETRKVLASPSWVHPVPGMSLIIEDVDELLAKDSKLKELGFQESEAHKRNVGVQGTIYAVNESHKCETCGKRCNVIGFKPGDKVLYSKFIAEQICIKDEQGKEIKNLRSVPVGGILATLDV